MTGKITKIGLALLIAAGSLSTVAIHAADSPETVAKRKLQREIDRRRNDARDAMYNNIRGAKRIDGGGESAVDFNRSIVNERSVPGGSGLNSSSSMAPPDPSPGIPIGKSSYDYQHNQSQGHQIGHVPGTSVVHFIWMAWDIIPLTPEEDTRFVAYSSYTKAGNGGALNQIFGGVFLTDNDERGGYTNLSYNDANQAQVWLHKRQLTTAPYHTWHYDFPFPGSAGFNPPIELGGTEPHCTEVLWPHGDAARDAASAGVPLHVVSHDGNNCARDLVWYWRYDGTNWIGPSIIDSSFSLAYVCCDDPNSNKAAIVLNTDREAQFDGLNNIAYYESSTSGLGWLSGAEKGDINKVLLTSYDDDLDPTTADPQAWLHISAAYDGLGALHIVWDEQAEANIGADNTIRHWRNGTGTGNNLIRPVALGFWPSPLASGAFNLNLAKITMGIGDGATSCQDGAQTNADYVYVSYTQYAGLSAAEQDDASLEGLYNGEMYLTASNSRGNTWSPPVNLTNTKTPDCNPGPGAPGVGGIPPRPDSVCRSEAWGTITKNVRDIDILFVSDLDAGGIPQGEGNWQQNPIHYLRFPGGAANPNALHVCPVIAPNFEATLTAQSECEYHATQAGSNVETMTILNLGNATLTGSASVTTDFPGAPTLVLASPGAYSIVAGDPDITKSVTMNSNGAAQGLYSGQISITHNDGAEPSPRTFAIDFFVFNSFFCPEDEVIKTGVASPGSLQLEVGTNGRFASQNDEGGLWRFVDSSTSFFDASLVGAHGSQATDTTVFLRFFDRESNGQFGWRSQADMVVDTSAYGSGAGYATAKAKMSSADSVIGATVTWYMAQKASRDEIVIAHYQVYRHNPAVAVTNLMMGVLVDADITPASRLGNLQSGTENAPGIDGSKNLIWQTGVDTTGHPIVGTNTATRFRAGTSAQCSFEGARVGNTVDDLQGGGGPTDGFLYNQLVTLEGVDAFSDSTVDLYQIVAVDSGASIAVGETLSYALIFASDTISEVEFKKKIDTGIVMVNELNLCGCSCPCKYDPMPAASCDGVTTVLDVTQVINVAFRGVASVTDPGCPIQRTDVDANGVTTVIDVTKTINVAFRGQSVAANFCDPCNPVQSSCP